MEQTTEAARKAGLEMIAVPANTSAEVQDAALSLMSRHIDAVCQIAGNLTASSFPSIVQAAGKAKLPIFGFQSRGARRRVSCCSPRLLRRRKRSRTHGGTRHARGGSCFHAVYTTAHHTTAGQLESCKLLWSDHSRFDHPESNSGDPVTMEITRKGSGETVELKIHGRLDAYWSAHFSDEMNAVIREGAHHIHLDLSEVGYISSAGIRVFLHLYQQLKEIQGSLRISQISKQADSILELVGLKELLFEKSTADVPAKEIAAGRTVETRSANMEVFPLDHRGSLQCRVTGNPRLMNGFRFQENNASKLALSGNLFAVGLGAFGSDFTECRSRFGEFLAVAGAAAYLPADGTNVPDYLVSSGTYVPEMMVLYSVSCAGSFVSMVRFEARMEAGAIAFSELAEACLQITKSDAAGFVMVAETSGLMGAALTRSPASGPAPDAPFAYPEARDWISFTPERAHSRCLSLVAGILERGNNDLLSDFVRPAGGANLTGHFHAAAFPYRPLQKGVLDLPGTVSTLFEAESILGVLHLLRDDRAIGGAGESEFIRGACWISPISGVVR